jgi:hypothetical protein
VFPNIFRYPVPRQSRYLVRICPVTPADRITGFTVEAPLEIKVEAGHLLVEMIGQLLFP